MCRWIITPADENSLLNGAEEGRTVLNPVSSYLLKVSYALQPTWFDESWRKYFENTRLLHSKVSCYKLHVCQIPITEYLIVTEILPISGCNKYAKSVQNRTFNLQYNAIKHNTCRVQSTQPQHHKPQQCTTHKAVQLLTLTSTEQ